jgi:hypothetical protein
MDANGAPVDENGALMEKIDESLDEIGAQMDESELRRLCVSLVAEVRA